MSKRLCEIEYNKKRGEFMMKIHQVNESFG